MKYVTNYDIGKRKRQRGGINEDSVAVTVLHDGHRGGYTVDSSRVSDEVNNKNPSVHGPEDELNDQAADTNQENSGNETKVFPSWSGESNSSAHPQDRHAGIFVLADGAGGEQAGDIASYIATTVIPEELSREVHRARRLRSEGFGLDLDRKGFDDPPSDKAIESAIADAINKANREIVEYATEAGLGRMYTTVVVGVYLGEKLHYGWVGDSRLYVVNESHGEISPLTKDHAKTQQYEDEGRIDEIEAHVHPDGSEILRAIGGRGGTDPADVHHQVDTGTVPLFCEDMVLFTSDGLIDAQTDYVELYREYVSSNRDEEVGQRILDSVVTDDDIRDIMLEEPTIYDAADRFVEFSNEKGGKDNISVILFSDDGLPASPDPETSPLLKRSIDIDNPLEELETVVRED